MIPPEWQSSAFIVEINQARVGGKFIRNCNRGISSSVIETQFISIGEWIGRLIALIISQSPMSDKEQKVSSRWHQTDRKNYESISILP